MFFRLSVRMFVIGLLVLSSLWVAATFLPILYSVVSPPRDIRDIVLALETRASAPPDARATVEQTIASAGPLRRALQVGYYSGYAATLRHNNSHASRTIQVAYVAWFQNIPKPILLLITRSETDGVFQGYQLEEGAPMSLVGGYAFPLMTFALALVLFRRRRSRMLVDTDS